MKALRSDHGFTLSELIVVLGLLGVVLGVAWLGFGVASGGSRLSDRESRTSQEIGVPLLEAERLLMQRHYVRTGYSSVAGRNVSPGPYLVAFDTDRDNDSNSEFNIIEVTGRNLIFHRREVNDPAGWTSVTWSRDNYNREGNVPLFRYYDVDDRELTNAGDIATRSRTVVITIVTEYEGKRYTDSRTVLFRNR